MNMTALIVIIGAVVLAIITGALIGYEEDSIALGLICFVAFYFIYMFIGFITLALLFPASVQ